MIRRLPPPELLIEAPFLPDDFPRRLLRFKETLDVSWDVLATCIGADPRQVWRWREGTKPSGDSLYALFLLADRQPGGVRLLLGEDGDRGRHPVIWLPADRAAPGEQAGEDTRWR
ncbi:MAG: hypothetical protein F4Z61_06245 [Acidimicrobiia bacterium]|nr:hypothetical protein [Chloroflexota bacterium]MDE2669023.1 hypothetical protein [Chloroflexota bacterium]MXW69497.1 hypothetical protein [Acidimicrobiia bacterium]MYJ63320.1 hypothetical protein [Acidimicrobiia bacterium]